MASMLVMFNPLLESALSRYPDESAEREAWVAYRDAVKRLRPRKSEWGKYIFVSAKPARIKGKRVPAGTRLPRSSQRVGYLVYVQPPSKKYPRGVLVPAQKSVVRKWSTARKYNHKLPPEPQRQKSLEVYDYGRKRAAKKWHAERLSLRGVKSVKAKNRRRGRLDWNRDIVPAAKRELRALLRKRPSDRHFVLEGIVTLAGRSSSIRFFIDFKASDRQQWFDDRVFTEFVRRKLYAVMAQELSNRGLVSEGSAMFVKKLSYNKGKSRKNWLDSRGDPWEKTDLKEVRIVQFDLVASVVQLKPDDFREN